VLFNQIEKGLTDGGASDLSPDEARRSAVGDAFGDALACAGASFSLVFNR